MLKVLLLLSLTLNIYAGSLKKAKRYYKNNNIEKATKYFKQACDEGIEEACIKYNELEDPIAKAFALISQSRGEEALPYLKQACLDGFTRGCTIYESATGTSISIPKETIYFREIVNYTIKEEELPRPKAVEIALQYIWGKPQLSNLKYNTSKKYFLADLKFERKKNFQKQVIISIKEKDKKAFKEALDSLKIQAVFDVDKHNAQLKKVQVLYLGTYYTLKDYK